MSCRNRQEMLQEYLAGELTAEARSELELHLHACTGCRQDMKAYRALLRALPSMPDPQIPVDLSAQIMAAVRARRTVYRPVRETAAATLVRRSVLAVLGAAIVITMGSALWGWSSRIFSFAGRSLSQDIVAMWEAARDLWSLITLLGEVAGLLRPAALEFWTSMARAGGPLATYGPFLIAVYAGVLVLGALLCWRALFPWGERRLSHASS